MIIIFNKLADLARQYVRYFLRYPYLFVWPEVPSTSDNFNSLKTGYIPEKVPPETRYPSYNTLKFPFHHLFYTCHCMAPKAPPRPCNPSMVSLSPSLSHYRIKSDTCVYIREHEQAEHMSFGMDCVWPEPAHIYIRFQSLCVSG